LVAAGIWVWPGVLEHRFIPRHFGVVEQGRIYRSSQPSSSLVKKVLVKYNIRVIVNLIPDDPNDADQQAEKKAATELGIEVVRLPLNKNGTGDISKYALAIAEITEAEKKGKPVLVHCVSGTKRTGGVIAAYRLLVQKKDPDFVISELKRYGWKPKSNSVLLTYLNSNMAELAELLKKAGVISEIPSPLPQLP
jgi:protein tyrosine/serine phosphatase